MASSYLLMEDGGKLLLEDLGGALLLEDGTAPNTGRFLFFFRRRRR